MRSCAIFITAGLGLALAAGAANAAPLKEGRSIAAAPGGYVRLQGHGHRLAHGALRAGRAHVAHYADLKGDPGSGLGFYSLPYPYRVGAWRMHQREAYARYPNPVLSAMAADSVRYYGIPAGRGYRYGVYDPNEGVGTPFFAGYYAPSGGEDTPPVRPFP